MIPNYAFAGSGIGTILYNDSPIVPTEIGEYTFFENKAIELMDLSKATIIGKSAFNLASNFIGSADSDTERGVITIIVDEVEDLILANTPVVRVQFKNATTLGNKILGNANSLKQVKFLKQIDSECVGSAFEKLTTKNVDLFVYLTQDGINGLKWNNIEFKSITKEDKAWGVNNNEN